MASVSLISPPFTALSRAKSSVELHLCDADIMQEVLGEAFEMVRGFDQPLEHRVGVDLEHSGDRPNPQAFRQCTDRPHKPIGRHTLAMKDGAMGLQKVSPTAAAPQLSPGAAVWMTVGTDMAQPEPATIGTVGDRTEMP